MKYIRTKDRVYDTENLPYRIIKDNKVYKSGWDVEKPTFEADILAQADSIEELCDEYVLTHYFEETNYTKCEVLKEDKDLMIESVSLKKQHNKDKDLQNEFNIYGAIWTNEGLIYVAKMDNEGKLCLI